jgi:hypothetical protein
MELELLAPRDTKHPVKEWLHTWYSKLGYVQGEQKEFATDYPEFAKLLSEPCSFTVYTKDLKKTEEPPAEAPATQDDVTITNVTPD